jgi:predicted homoserine dehydrogenase-like protein
MDFFIRIGKGSYHESTPQTTFPDVVNYESIKRELKRRLIYEYRCDDRLKTKNEESTRLADTGFPCRKRGLSVASGHVSGMDLRPRFRHVVCFS